MCKGTIGKETPPIDKQSILDAVKLIASLKPIPIQPFSIGNIGGIKIISNPFIPEGSIIVSDDIWRDLQKLSTEYNKENINDTSDNTNQS